MAKLKSCVLVTMTSPPLGTSGRRSRTRVAHESTSLHGGSAGVLIVFHFNQIMILLCFYLLVELIFVYSYSWHSFHYDLGHSFGPLHGLLCFSIPAGSDSALIAPISPFISGVTSKLPIPRVVPFQHPPLENWCF